ncbi:glycosyltransferase family 2 protein [Candidatus Bipolaricaulota sp. J31]
MRGGVVSGISEALVIVPTYWTFPGGERAGERVSYDHPTPLDQRGTLARLLESLEDLRGPDFGVFIIAATTAPELEATASEKVEGLIAPFRRSFPIACFGARDLAFLRERLDAMGFAQAPLSLQGYGNVRNIQLAIAQGLGAEVMVSLDDDEVVADPMFLEKALEFMGEDHGGRRVLGKGGFYLDAAGRKLPPMERESGDGGEGLFARKLAIMQEALRGLEARPDRLVETSFVYGGNMVIHRELFTQVPFDPHIPRGEDIDYVLNARLAGHRFHFDKELAIVHLPPPTREHLREDVIRFIYEWLKLERVGGRGGFTPVSVEELDPYPGAFLREGLEGEARRALRKRGYPEAIVDEALAFSERALDAFLGLWRGWAGIMEAIGKDRALRDHLRRKLGA